MKVNLYVPTSSSCGYSKDNFSIKNSRLSASIRAALMVVFLLTFSYGTVKANTVTIASGTSNWSAIITGSGTGGIPSSSDAVTLSSGAVVTMDVASGACSSLTFATASVANSLTIASTNTLTVTGAVTMPAPTGSVSTTLAVGAGTLSAASFSVTSGTSPKIAVVTVSTGTITCTGNFTFAGTAATAQLTFTGAGTLNIGGTLSQNTLGTVTMFAGNIFNYNGSSQTLRTAAYNYLNLSGSGAKTMTSVTTINNNLTLSGTATSTNASLMTISGNLIIGDGTAFTTGNAIAVTGTTTVGSSTGATLTLATAGTAMTFTGAVTVSSGSTITISSTSGTKTFVGLVTNSGTWTNSANLAITFEGGITNNGTFTTGSGIQTFSTHAQSLTGTFSIPSITVTGITLTNNGTLSVATALAGTGGITQGTGATLNITPATITLATLTASATGNTVNFNGSTQNIGPASTIGWNHFYNLILSNQNAKTVKTGAATINIDGNFNIHCVGNGNDVSIAGLNSNYTVTIGGAFSLDTMGCDYTDGGATTNIGGNFINNGFSSAFTSTGTVVFDGSTQQTISGYYRTQFNNVTLSNTSASGIGVVLGTLTSYAAGSSIINGTLTFTNNGSNYELLGLGGNNIVVGTISNYSSNNFVVADLNYPTTGAGTGKLQIKFPVATGQTFTFPVGTTTGPSGTSYSPVTISNATVQFIGDSIGVNVSNTLNTNATGLQCSYLNRYWNLTDAEGEMSAYTPTFQVVTADVVGNYANVKMNYWNGSAWTSLTTTPATVTGGYTFAASATPTSLSSSATPFTGFSTTLAPAAPSVSVTNNCGNSTLTAGSYTGSLLWNTAATTSSINVTSAGTYSVTQTITAGCPSPAGTGTAAPKAVPATPVVNVTNNCGNSVLSTTAAGSLLWSTGVTTTSITVTNAATYSVTATNASSCTSSAGTNTSAPLSIPATPVVVVLENCNGTTTLSTTAGGTLVWNTAATTSSINVSTAGTYSVTQTAGGCISSAGTGTAAARTTTATPVITTTPVTTATTSVSGNSNGEADGSVITLYINGAAQPTVTVSGGNWTVSGLTLTLGQTITVTDSASGKCVSSPTAGVTVQSSVSSVITVSGTLPAMSATYGTPSLADSMTVSGTNMAAGILVTPPSGFEVSQTTATTGFAATQTVGSSGTIASTTIYVRLAATTPVGTYSGNDSCSSVGATSQTIAIASSTVSAAVLTVTANSYSVTYGSVAPTYSATITGYVNGQNSSVVSGSPSLSSSYTSTTPVSASPVTITAAAGTLSAANYSFTFVNGLVTINPQALTVTATGPTKIYGTALSVVTGSTTNFNASGTITGETVSSVTLTPNAAGLSATTAAGATYSVTPSAVAITGGNASAANYSITYISYSGTVGAYTLTISGITANNKAYDGTTTATLSGTATLSATVNSDVITLGGTPTATFASANVANGITVTVTGYTISGTNATDYTLTQPTLSANITQANQTITFSALSNQTYGNADFSPGATASSGLTVSYSSSNTAVATIVSGNIHIVAAGTCNITASQAGNGNYNAATNVVQSLTINQEPLTITANNVNKVVGTTLSSPVTGSTAFTSSGLVLSQTIGSVTITYGSGASSGSAVGIYIGSVTVSSATGGTFTASNYSITYASGNIIVTPPTKYWLNSKTGSQSWTTTSNWSTISNTGATCNCVPVTGDSVVFANTSAVTVSSVPTASNGSLTLEGLSTGAGGVTLNSSFGALTITNFTMNDGSVALGTLYMEVTNNLTLAGAGSLTMGATYNIVADNIININGSGSITLNGPSSNSFTSPGTLNITGSGNFNTGSNLWVLELNNLNLSGTGSVVWQNPGGANSIVIVNGAIAETGSGMIDFSSGSSTTNYVEFLASSCTNSSSNFTIKTRQWKTEVIFDGVGTHAVPFVSPVFYGSAPTDEPSSILIENNSYISLNSSGFPLSKNEQNGGGTTVSQTLELDYGSTLDCSTSVIQGPVGSVECPACPAETINGTIKTAFSTGLFSFSGTFQGVTINVTMGSGSTVEYNASGAQDLTSDLSYIASSNIILSGSGAKTISTGANGSLTSDILFIDQSATASVTNSNVSVGRLWLNNAAQTAGTYGSTSSAATNKNNTYFTSGVTGYLNVLSSGTNAVFSNLTPTTALCASTNSVTLTGTVSGAANGDSVSITLNGVTQQVLISGGSGGFSVTFTGLGSLAAGTYPITYKYDGIALNPATNSSTSLSVGVGPSASVLSGAATICSGTSTNLSIAITGGQSPYSYNINNGALTGSSYTSGSNISTGNLSATTTYSITSVTDACGLTSTGLSGSAVITVNSIPTAPTTGSSGSCSGSTLSLTASSTGTTYSWTGPGGFTSSLQNPTVSSSATTGMSGTYSVTATTSGCTSGYGTTTVTVNTTPTAPTAGSSGSCTNSPLSLTASSTGTTYSWTGPSGFTSASQNPTVSSSATTAMSGTYSVTATTSGCTSGYGTNTVTIASCSFTFNVNFFIQGYYIGGGKMSPMLKLLGTSVNATDVDNVTVGLYSSPSNSTADYTYNGVLQSDGTLACTFPAGASGSFYILITHRNSIATWSNGAQSITASGTYDFRTAASQAYGSNMANLDGAHFGIYSGDINQDGHINGTDKTLLQTALSSFTMGSANINDMTGDGFVDEDDYRIMQNNISLAISVIHP